MSNITPNLHVIDLSFSEEEIVSKKEIAIQVLSDLKKFKPNLCKGKSSARPWNRIEELYLLKIYCNSSDQYPSMSAFSKKIMPLFEDRSASAIQCKLTKLLIEKPSNDINHKK